MTRVFQAAGLDLPASTAIQFYEEAVAESRAAGGDNSLGAAEFIRKAQKGDPVLATAYQARKEAGVTDEDIRSYWDTSDVEKRVIVKMEDWSRMATFLAGMDQAATDHPDYDDAGLAELAAHHVRKFHPTYGNPADDAHFSGEDRPLYPELKDRIDQYMQANSADADALRRRIDQATSFNALVRTEIRADRL